MTDQDRIPEDLRTDAQSKRKKWFIILITLAVCIIAVAVTAVLVFSPTLIPAAPEWLEDVPTSVETDGEGRVTAVMLQGRRLAVTYKGTEWGHDDYEDENDDHQSFYAGTTIPYMLHSRSRSDRTEAMTEAEALAVANDVVKSLTGLESLDHYEIKVEKDTIGQRESYAVDYLFRIQDYPTDERITVKLYANGDLYSFTNYAWEAYSCYPKVSRLDIQRGIADLKEQGGDPDLDYYFLDVDDEGYLCLKTEIIGPQDTSREHESNCGHSHYFCTYRLSKEPNPKKGDNS